MLISYITLILSCLLPDPQTPNFYPGLASARDASKKTQKEMIIFFSDKTCGNCESAWVAFIKDENATNKYVSTRMDVGDFDGGIFFDLLDLEEVPSWVILYPDGTEKERWEGGWKDAEGNPTAFEKELTVTTPVTQKQKSTTTTPVTTSSTSMNNSTMKSETQNNSTKNVSNTNTTVQSGYFLQAGYFGSEANAMKLVNDLKTKGFTDFEIKKETKDGSVFYRVVSKTFAIEREAVSYQENMTAVGFKTSVKMI